MKKKIKQIIKRIYVRWLLWNKTAKWLKPDEEMDEYEKISGIICRKLMSMPDTKYSIAPLSEKRYIINERLGMFIVLEPSNRNIELTNHVYHYSVRMSEKKIQNDCFHI